MEHNCTLLNKLQFNLAFKVDAQNLKIIKTWWTGNGVQSLNTVASQNLLYERNFSALDEFARIYLLPCSLTQTPNATSCQCSHFPLNFI